MILGAWSPTAWAALGAWATFLIYVILGLYARKQVGEARRLREEQARPWVVVDFEPGWILWLTIENIGKTVATNVKVRFEPPLASTQKRPWEWEESSAFTQGIPLLPPNKKLRFFFDSITVRLNDDVLPKHYDVSVEYHGPIKRKKPLVSTYRLDISHYWGMSPPPKGLPEVVKTLEEIQKEMHKWTDGISGIKAKVVDRNKEVRSQDRSYRLRRAKQLRKSEGWIAAGKVLIVEPLQLRGWWFS